MPVPLTDRERQDLERRLREAGCVFAEDEAALLTDEAPDRATLDALVARRVTGEPLEQVLGWAQFAGRRVRVAPGVFVPRRRTELLVRQALGVGAGARVVVDLCCGTAAVGAAVAAGLTGAELWACDVDPAAVECARLNVPPDSHVLHGDLDAPLPSTLAGRVDLLLANAPYVPTAEIPLMPPEAREHEARVALDGGADGLELHRRIAASARRWLAPRGHLLIETSRRQAPLTLAACESHGLLGTVVHDPAVDGTVVVAHPA